VRLFGKKEESAETPDIASDAPPAPMQATSKDIALLQKDVETMKAMISTLREMKKDDQEKFSRLLEQIGELRSMLFTKEQEMKDINVRVGKAIDLVETAQVEKILVEKKKEDAKVQILGAKIDSYKAISDNIITELKDIRGKIEMFKGTEQVLKLNSEIKHDLASTKLLKNEIERHADRIENAFIDFNKKYDEYRVFKNEIEKLRDKITLTLKEIDQFKVEFRNLAKKEDLIMIEGDVSRKLRSVDEYRNMFETLKTTIIQIKDDLALEKNNFMEWHARMRQEAEEEGEIEELQKNFLEIKNSLHGNIIKINRWIGHFNSKLQSMEENAGQNNLQGGQKNQGGARNKNS